MAGRKIADLMIKLGADSAEFQSKMVKVERNILQFSKKIDQIGKEMSMKISAPLAVLGGASLVVTSQFDAATREVSTLSENISKNLQSVSNDIISLTRKIPIEATAAAKSLYQIVSAGHDGAAGMKVLEVSAKAAVAGVTDTAVAADAITTMLNAYKKGSEEALNISDQLFTTVRLGKTTFGALGQSISHAVPIAASFGIETDQVLAAVATLTKSGTPTAQAMTQIRAAILAASKILGDGAFKTRTFQEGLAEIAAMAGGSESKLRKLIPEIEGMNGVLGLTGLNAKTAAADLEQLRSSSGATELAYGKMADGFSNKVQLLKNNFSAVMIQVGTTLIPIVEKIITVLNRVATVLGNMSEPMRRFIVVIGGVVTAIGPLLLTLGAAAKLLPTLAAGLSMILGPVGAVAAGIIGLGLALYACNRDTNTVNDAVKRLKSTNEEYNSSVAKEQAVIDQMFGRLQALTRGTKEYESAKQAIQNKYGAYLKGLGDEVTSLNDVASAYRAISTASKQAARDRAIQRATEEAADTYGDKEVDNLKLIRNKLIGKFGDFEGEKLFTNLKTDLLRGSSFDPGVYNAIKSFTQRSLQGSGGLATSAVWKDINPIALAIKEIQDAKKVFEYESKEINAIWGGVENSVSGATDAVVNEVAVMNHSVGATVGIINSIKTQIDELEKKKLLPNTTVEDIAKINVQLDQLKIKLDAIINAKPGRIEEPKVAGDIQTVGPDYKPISYKNADAVFDPGKLYIDPDQYIKPIATALTEINRGIADKMVDFTKQREITVASFAEELMIGFADSIGGIIVGDLGFGDLLIKIGIQIGDFIRQLGIDMLMASNFMIKFKIAINKLLALPFAGAALGLAMIAAGTALSAGLRKKAEAKAPKLAKGGLAYGPTYAMIGDNPNASVDPEVVAPLSKLQHMIKGDRGDINLNIGGEFRIKGSDLQLLLNKNSIRTKLVTG